MNAWTSLYETWYVYHDTWAHVSGVLHKSLTSVCVSVCVSFLLFLGKRSFLGNSSVNTFPRQLIHAAIEESLDACVYLSVYLVIVVKQQLGKDVPAAKKNFWKPRFVCGPCGVRGKWVISSSQNLLAFVTYFEEMNVSLCEVYSYCHG
jgi:hypothetical protein